MAALSVSKSAFLSIIDIRELVLLLFTSLQWMKVGIAELRRVLFMLGVTFGALEKVKSKSDLRCSWNPDRLIAHWGGAGWWFPSSAHLKSIQPASHCWWTGWGVDPHVTFYSELLLLLKHKTWDRLLNLRKRNKAAVVGRAQQNYSV